MKKFLSLVLALVMTMSLVTISAGAADFTDDEAITYEEAVEVMTAIGVVSGYQDGSFKPGTALNRGQAAKIICNMILGPTTAAALATTDAAFKDVPADHVFAGYIAYCVSEGIVSGYADGTFKPANPLTGYAFWKMLLGALGYDADIEGYNQPNWAVQVAKRGLNIGLDDGLKGDFVGTKALTREEACLYAFNTLKSDMVDYGNKTAITIGDINITTSAEVGKVYSDKDADKQLADEIVGDEYDYVQFAEEYFDDLEGEKTTDVFGRPATKWTWDGDKVGTYAKEAKYTFTYDKFYSIDNLDELIETLQDITGNKKLDIDDENLPDVYANGATDDVSALAYYAVPGINVELFVSKNEVTDAIILVPEAAQITDIDDELSKADTKKGASKLLTLTYLYDEAEEEFYDAHDTKSKNVLAGYDAETYTEDAVLVVYRNFAKMDRDEAQALIAVEEEEEEPVSNPADDADTVLASYIAEAEEGTLKTIAVSMKDMKFSLKLDDTKYPVAVWYFAGDEGAALGKEQTVYMTEEGYAVAIDGPSSQNIDDVYYVTGVYKTTSAKGTVTYMAETVALDGTQADMKLEYKADKWEEDELVAIYESAAEADELVGGKFAPVGGLYILTDEAIKEDGETLCKAKDSKYNAVEFEYFYDADIEEYDESNSYNGYVIKAYGDLTKDVKSTDTKMLVDDEKVYYGDDTTFVSIEKKGDDLKVATATGSVKLASEYDEDAFATVIALVDVDDTKIATNVLYIAGDIDAAVASDEVLYIAYNGDYEIGEDFVVENAWFMADVAAEEITIDDTSRSTRVFAHFTVDADDVYTLTILDEDDDLDEDVDDDTDGFLQGATFTEENTYKSKLTLDTEFDFDDVDYSNATINDDRDDIDGDALYDSEINSVSRLNKAIKEGDIVADIYVKDGEIVFINILGWAD